MFKNIVLMAGAASMMSSAASAKPLTLESSSDWHVVYDKDSCRLTRSYGTGNDRVIVHLAQYAPVDLFNLTLSGRPVRTRKFEQDVTFQFGPEEQQVATALSGETDDGQASIIFGSTVRLAPLSDAERVFARLARPHHTASASLSKEREAAITFLRFARGLRLELVLQTGPLHDPLEALRKCSWDTVGDWGLDIEQQKNLRSPPIPTADPENWLVSSDYPHGMLFLRRQALIYFRLMVDETGKAESCHIQASAGEKAFDDAVCRGLMRRAAFEPAKDQNGLAIRSYFHSSVFFKIRQ